MNHLSDLKDLLYMIGILFLIWILAYIVTYVTGETPSTWDTWTVNTGDDPSMTWSIMCDTAGILVAMKHGIYPTTYNLFDNLQACRITYDNRYIDSVAELQELGEQYRHNIYALVIKSNAFNQYYVLQPEELYKTTLLIEGIIQQLAAHHISHLRTMREIQDHTVLPKEGDGSVSTMQ